MGTFGVKNVDLGGMFTPAAAISRIWLTGVPRRKNATSKAPESIRASASSSLREYPRPRKCEMSSSVSPSGPVRISASSTAVSRRR